ncbi:hypothetical protein AURDEDRAFT_163131 [Auricularia subglabra TFB-10046 SS5]|nr:hypothetical protein AURDEDRAFT_163131 [Auricularia subglabra TFB-10046 SS5]
MSPIEERIRAWGAPPAVPSVVQYDPAEFLGSECVPDGVRLALSPEPFNSLHTSFRSMLARPALPALNPVDAPKAAFIPDEWNHWLSITQAWAAQACFPPGELDKENIGLSLRLDILGPVGLMLTFAVSNVPHDPEQQAKARSWHWQKGPMGNTYPFAIKKSCPPTARWTGTSFAVAILESVVGLDTLRQLSSLDLALLRLLCHLSHLGSCPDA